MRLEATLAVLQAHRVSFNETAQRHGMAVTEAQVSALHARLCVDSFQGLAMHRDACVAKLPRALTRPYGQLTVGSFDRVVDAQFVLGGGLLIADVANGMPRRTTGASETQQRLGAWLAAIKPLVRDLNEAAASSPTVRRALHRVGAARRVVCVVRLMAPWWWCTPRVRPWRFASPVPRWGRHRRVSVAAACTRWQRGAP